MASSRKFSTTAKPLAFSWARADEGNVGIDETATIDREGVRDARKRTAVDIRRRGGIVCAGYRSCRADGELRTGLMRWARCTRERARLCHHPPSCPFGICARSCMRRPSGSGLASCPMGRQEAAGAAAGWPRDPTTADASLGAPGTLGALRSGRADRSVGRRAACTVPWGRAGQATQTNSRSRRSVWFGEDVCE